MVATPHEPLMYNPNHLDSTLGIPDNKVFKPVPAGVSEWLRETGTEVP